MLIKIYKIVNNIDKRIYIGSTIQPLYKRFGDHVKRWRRKNLTQYSSSLLFDFCGYKNCKIVLEAEEEVENLEYAKKLEREYIDKYNDVCVNKHLPYKSEDEHQADKDRYYETRCVTTQTRDFKDLRNLRTCCVLCKCELSKASLARHYKLKHNIIKK